MLKRQEDKGMNNKKKNKKQMFTKEKNIEKNMNLKEKSINKQQAVEDEIIKKIVNEYTTEQGKKIEEEIRDINKNDREKYEDMITVSLQDILKAAENEKRGKRNKFKIIISPILYKVAAVVAVLLLAFDISIVAVPAFRDNVLRFFEESANTHTSIEVTSEENAEVLEEKDKYNIGPKVEYRISYLPDGFEVVSEERNATSFQAQYEKKSDGMISFFQWTDNSIVNIDTEDARTYHRIINNADVIINEKDNNILATWRMENYFIQVYSQGVTEKEMLRIIESVEK